MPRILLLHASVGMGHQRAALALARVFEQLPGVSAQVEDTLDHARPLFSRSYRGSYLSIADRAPSLWSRFYQQTDRPHGPDSLLGLARALSTSVGVRQLPELLARARPDAIVCTHFLPVEALAPLRRYGLPPISCVITDYHAHAFWAFEGADRYFVPTARARMELIAAGIPAAQVQVTGIPIDPALNQPLDRVAARRVLGVPAWQPIVTLIGSGMPAERVRAIVQTLLARRLPATLVVAVGRNHELATRLADIELRAGAALCVLGPQPSLDPLIATSELVIGKAGGLTVSEVLARGVPLIIPTPVAGQELWNVDYVVHAGAGLGRRSAADLAQAVDDLLHDRARRAAMAAAAQAAGRPAAAATIAARVLADIGHARPAGLFQPIAAFG
jgi:processive 1,2-diacylglycerol beta-glucosyltransferase